MNGIDDRIATAGEDKKMLTALMEELLNEAAAAHSGGYLIDAAVFERAASDVVAQASRIMFRVVP